MQLNGRTALDLFSGVGGFALACERVGIRTVAFCEIDPFCRAVLAKNFPGIPVHDDIRTLDPAPFRGVDLVCGGFPCQDLSAAGKGAGIGGTRSGLWFEMARIIAGVRPRWCLIENVSAARTRGADRVLADLEALGYDAWPLVVGAWSVGAPHRRERVWIVARLYDEGASGHLADADKSGERQPDELRRVGGTGRAGTPAIGRRGEARLGDPALADAASSRQPTGTREPRRSIWNPARSEEPERRRGVLGDPECNRGHEKHSDCGGSQTSRAEEALPRAELADWRDHTWPARPGQPQHEWEQPRLVEFALGGPTDGLPVGLVRARRRNNREALKAYGNAIVPDCAEAILRAMLKEEEHQLPCGGTP